MVKIISEPSAKRNTMFKVIRSNTEIAITSLQIARLRSNFGTEFHHVTGDTLQMFRVKGKVMYQQQKRCIILQWIIGYVQRIQTWHGVVNKSGEDWRGVGTRAASSCNAFAIATFSSK